MLSFATTAIINLGLLLIDDLVMEQLAYSFGVLVTGKEMPAPRFFLRSSTSIDLVFYRSGVAYLHGYCLLAKVSTWSSSYCWGLES